MARTEPDKGRTAWGWCRRWFRCLRIAILGGILGVLLVLTWLRFAGLPTFLRVRIVDALARRGIVANFQALHFHWFRGFVAQDLRVTWGGTNGPRVHIAEADLDLAPPPWRDAGASLVRGLSVRRGEVVVPLLVTNEPAEELRLDEITGQIRFLAGDRWEVPHLEARFMGLQFDLRATLTNTAALRRARGPRDPGASENRLRLLRAVVAELGLWSPAPDTRIEVGLQVDGNDPSGATGDIYLDVPSARTPHGDIQRLRVSIRAQPASNAADPVLANATVELGELMTGDGGLSGLVLRARLTGPPRPGLPTNATFEARVDHLFTRSLRARHLTVEGSAHVPPGGSTSAPDRARLFSDLDGDIRLRALRVEAAPPGRERHTARNVSAALAASLRAGSRMPHRVSGTVAAEGIDGTQGSTGPWTLRLAIDSRTNAPPAPPGMAWWEQAWPFEGSVALEVEAVDSPKLDVGKLNLELDWRPPAVGIRRLDATLYGGELKSTGGLDLVSREARLAAETTFDLHGIDGLLGPRGRENFQRYQWTLPPRFVGEVRAILPAWTNREPDWNGEVRPTVKLNGRFNMGAGGYRGIPFTRAESSLAFDGSTWRLPDLRTESREGRQEVAIEYNEDTREYHIEARGQVIPSVLVPVLGSQSAEVLDLFEFKEPADAQVSVWGPWTEGSRQSVLGSIVVSNVLFRGQRFDRLEATVNYTNRFLVASPVRLGRDAGEVIAAGVGYDFGTGRLWLTNAVSTIDPLVAGAAISPGFEEKLVHYKFAHPPRVEANGTLEPRTPGDADLAFDISGGPFSFWRLSADTIASRLYWRGTSLTLTNIAARFYEGSLTGDAEFDLANPDDGVYRFYARVRDANLGALLHEATEGRTNVAKGTFDLDLDVTSARTSDINTWNGSGRAALRDGRLWDAPIFGFLSPVLNAVVPGLGNNRARGADATFTLTNSVVHTRDMIIACPPAKLSYRGTLDFEQRVNAKVEAQVLGDFTPMGPLFGLILRPLTKLFEFKVTGTLTEVKTEPLYVPKFLLLPLQPLKVLRGLFSGGSEPSASGTNAPPEPEK